MNKVIIIINTHHAQESANTLNEFSKMSHDNTELFNNVATSTIPIIDTFNTQDLSNNLNPFTKMNHDNPGLFS